MENSNETTSLLGANGESKNFYFLKKEKSSIIDEDEGHSKQFLESNITTSSSSALPQDGSTFSWFTNLFQRKADHPYQSIPQPLPRKLPVKVEPKVFFANERTFLAWLHMSVTLASISVAIVAFADANDWSQVYGLTILPVAIAFCAYSLWMYMKRSAMIRRKDPGPYEDKYGPIMLASMLAIATVFNFIAKIVQYST